MEIRNLRYTALKLKCLDHWIWFETSKTERKDGQFVGINGWGKNSGSTDVECDVFLIEGIITSETLQYK